MSEIPKDSILNVTKKLLNAPVDYDFFDLDVLTHINSVFANLSQMGVGPKEGFFITDGSTPWSEYIKGDSNLNGVQSYMVNKVRLMFDLPTTSFAIAAIEKLCAEFEWRLHVASETP